MVRVENTRKGISPFYSASNKGGSSSFNYLEVLPTEPSVQRGWFLGGV